jgi:hypothetical protein
MDGAREMEDYYEWVRQRDPSLVRSVEYLQEVIAAVEAWNGEDVEPMQRIFRLYEELRETSRYYPPASRKLVGEFAEAVNALRLKAFPADTKAKMHHPGYAAFSPILQGRNGSILWFNPETNGLLIT